MRDDIGAREPNQHDALLEAASGDSGLARELAELFLKEMPRRLAELHSAAGAGDSLGIQTASHTLKGSAAALGFGDVADGALAIERGARDGTLDPYAVQEMKHLADVCEAAGRWTRAFLEGSP